jgi:hypothetical protein
MRLRFSTLAPRYDTASLRSVMTVQANVIPVPIGSGLVITISLSFAAFSVGPAFHHESLSMVLAESGLAHQEAGGAEADGKNKPASLVAGSWFVPEHIASGDLSQSQDYARIAEDGVWP